MYCHYVIAKYINCEAFSSRDSYLYVFKIISVFCTKCLHEFQDKYIKILFCLQRAFIQMC